MYTFARSPVSLTLSLFSDTSIIASPLNLRVVLVKLTSGKLFIEGGFPDRF